MRIISSAFTEFREKFRSPCPDCQKPMFNIGIGFKPPKNLISKRGAAWSVKRAREGAFGMSRHGPNRRFEFSN